MCKRDKCIAVVFDNKIGRRLFKILYIFYGKIILQARTNVFLLFNAKLSQDLLSKFRDKKIKFANQASLIITSKILTDSIDGIDNKFYEEQKETIDRELAIVVASSEYKKIAADYHLLTAFYYSYGFTTDAFNKKYEENFSKAKSYDDNTTPVTTKTFNNIRIQIKRRLAVEKNQLVSQLREIQKQEFFKTFPKIEITSGQIASLIGIVSTVFFMAGFIYNKYFLGFFNVNVSRFFTISDYLATSVDKIFPAAISALIGLFFYINGIFNGYRRVIAEYQFEQKIKRHDGIIYASMIGWLILTTFAWFMDLPNKHHLLSLSIFIAAMFLFQSIPLHKYVKDNADISIAIIFSVLLSFSLLMYEKVMDEREIVLSSDVAALKEYNFKFDGKVGFDDKATFLLAANSEYFIFCESKCNKTYIVPKNRIKAIEVMQEKSHEKDNLISLFRALLTGPRNENKH